MKDPFEAAYILQSSPPESPSATAVQEEEDGDRNLTVVVDPPTQAGGGDEDEEDDTMAEAELGNFASSNAASASPDPNFLKMQAVLSRFTNEQMDRYESFRRSGFQKANMKRLLAGIIGTQKISTPVTIVVSSIAKMFVGDLVETARIVMAERKTSGPIRPCHIREAYRRLKLEGKVPRRSVPRLFR